MTQFRQMLHMCAFLMFCMVMASCASQDLRPEQPQEGVEIKSILIVPFSDLSRIYGSDVESRCQLCGQVISTGFVPDTASPYLTAELTAILDKQKDYTILSSEGTLDMLSGLAGGTDHSPTSYLNLYIKAGKRVEADAVLVGYIFRFKERQGNRVSVESPASVAFDLHLIHVATGRIVWTGHYDETQRSLSENLLDLGTFLKRGASWVTAEELAKGGLENMMRRFPKP
jgi:hypothetical protein